jgi:hypothetical protein
MQPKITDFVVGTARCAVRAAFSGATDNDGAGRQFSVPQFDFNHG